MHLASEGKIGDKRQVLQLFLGAACLGFAPIFVKLVNLGPTSIGAYRCGIAALVLGLLSLRDPFPKQAKIDPKLWYYTTLAGLLFALDLFVWHRSVIYAGAGLGTILGNTQVFYAAALGILFFGDRLTLRFITSVVLAFCGTYMLISYRLGTPGEHYWEGVFYGLSTGVVYCTYVLAMRQVEKYAQGVSAALRLALMSAVTAIVLTGTSLVEGTMRWPSSEEWFWLVLLALVAQVLGWLLISKNLLKVSVSRAGLILITQPLVSVLAGAWLFQEQLGVVQAVGAGLVFIALYLGTTRR